MSISCKSRDPEAESTTSKQLLVVLPPKMRDLLLASEPPQRVLQLPILCDRSPLPSTPPSAAWIVQKRIITRAENARAEPAVDSQHPGLEAGCEHLLHEGLPRLELLQDA